MVKWSVMIIPKPIKGEFKRNLDNLLKFAKQK